LFLNPGLQCEHQGAASAWQLAAVLRQASACFSHSNQQLFTAAERRMACSQMLNSRVVLQVTAMKLA
jgi:hypothetical protein